MILFTKLDCNIAATCALASRYYPCRNGPLTCRSPLLAQAWTGIASYRKHCGLTGCSQPTHYMPLERATNARIPLPPVLEYGTCSPTFSPLLAELSPILLLLYSHSTRTSNNKSFDPKDFQFWQLNSYGNGNLHFVSLHVLTLGIMHYMLPKTRTGKSLYHISAPVDMFSLQAYLLINPHPRGNINEWLCFFS